MITPRSYTICEDFYKKIFYLLSRLINAIFDNFARTGETQKKEGLPFLVARSSTQQEVMTPSLYIVGYNNNVVFYLTEVVGKMCFRPRGVVPFDSYTDGGIRLVLRHYACVFTVFRCVFPRYSLYIVYEE